jgi:hypothetical protein
MNSRILSGTGNWVTRTASQSCLLVAIAGFLVLAGLCSPSQAADVLPAQPPTDFAAAETRLAAARATPAYKLIVDQTRLPSVTVADSATLEVRDEIRVSLTPPVRLTAEQQAALTNLLQVPIAVITNCLASLTNQPGAESQELAQKLRTAVLDYKFLASEWTKQPEGVTKVEALKSLEAGEIGEAWRHFNAQTNTSSRPAPPSPPKGLRLVVSPN